MRSVCLGADHTEHAVGWYRDGCVPADGVAANVWARVNQAAEKAIAERGHFALGIPGGSILKMLQGNAPWAPSTTLAYVNQCANVVQTYVLSASL